MERYGMWATTAEAYRFVFGHLRNCITLCMVPVAAVTGGLGLVFLVFYALSAATAGDDTLAFEAGAWIFIPVLAVLLAYLAIYVMFAVAWHRHYLVGTDPVSPLAIFRWRRQHWRFLLKGVLLFVALGVLFLLFGQFAMLPIRGMLGHGRSPFSGEVDFGTLFLILTTVTILLNLIFIYLASRFALAFPAASIDDDDTGLRTSWMLTDGNSFKFFGVLLMVLLPIYLFGMALDVIVGFLNDRPSGIAEVVTFLIVLSIKLVSYFVGVALTASALSITYRKLKAIDDAARAHSAGGGGQTV